MSHNNLFFLFIKLKKKKYLALIISFKVRPLIKYVQLPDNTHRQVQWKNIEPEI